MYSISVVCPVLNEEEYIENLFKFIEESTIKPLEVFLVDGGSDDDTVAKIKAWQQKHPHVHLLHNPDKYVPYALNLAIPRCRGDVIVRLDAHTEYAADYFERIIECFETTGADIVGGPMRATGKNAFQRAVAEATSSKFGVGNSRFHFEEYNGVSDSVYLGAWKRELFDAIGLFDERLVRNQDDEFHYRARANGFTIYQDSKIKSYYYPRDTFKGLVRQYFQYGLYKPLVLRKIRSEIKLRHLVPAGFVLYLVGLPLLLIVHWGFILPLFLYLIILGYKFFDSKLPMNARKYLPVVFPAIHLAYGSGFILGIGKLFRKA